MAERPDSDADMRHDAAERATSDAESPAGSDTPSDDAATGSGQSDAAPSWLEDTASWEMPSTADEVALREDAEARGAAIARRAAGAREPMEPRTPLEERAQPRRIEPRDGGPTEPPRWQPAYHGSPSPRPATAPGSINDPHPLFTHGPRHGRDEMDAPAAGGAAAPGTGAADPPRPAHPAGPDVPRQRSEWRARAPLGALSVGLILTLGLSGAVVVALRAQDRAGEAAAPEVSAGPAAAPGPEASGPADGPPPALAVTPPPAPRVPEHRAPEQGATEHRATDARPVHAAVSGALPGVLVPGLTPMLVDLPTSAPKIPAARRLPAERLPGAGSDPAGRSDGGTLARPNANLRDGLRRELPVDLGDRAGHGDRDEDHDGDRAEDRADDNGEDNDLSPRLRRNTQGSEGVLGVLDVLGGGLGLG